MAPNMSTSTSMLWRTITYFHEGSPPVLRPHLLSVRRMADPRGAPGFGQVDETVVPHIEDGSANTTVRPRPPSVRSDHAFGEVDFDLGSEEEPAAPPESTSRAAVADRAGARTVDRSKRATRKNVQEHTDMTRVVSGDALSNITRPPPPMDSGQEDGSTRAWAEIDDQLLAVARGESDEAPASSRSGHRPAPSGSGVATRDNRVAAMRELYAKGDADGALALAETLGHSIAPGNGADHPDASIVVEFGEQSIDLEDPFGGLIPLDDDLAAKPTVAPGQMAPTAAPPPHASGPHASGLPASGPHASSSHATSPHATSPPCAAPQLTLTERHSIPRLLKSMGEVSKLKIDHRAGFLLAHVDGMQTLEEILDICAMPSAEALELFANLKEMGVIEFE